MTFHNFDEIMSGLEKQFKRRLSQGAFGFGLTFSVLVISSLLA